MLRIGFDAKRLFNNFTGLGNYSRTLLKNLAYYYPEFAYFLYTPSAKDTEDTKVFLNSPLYSVHTPKRMERLLWRSYRIRQYLFKHKISLYHGLSNEIPFGLNKTSIKSVVTIHDLIYKIHPSHYPTPDRQIYHQKTQYACKNADRIIAISECTKQDIINHYQIDPEKISVIYQSCNEAFLQKKSEVLIENVRKRYQLPPHYMLYVGSLTERKNLLGVLQAMVQLPSDLQIPLVVVGGGGKNYRQKVHQFIHKNHLEKLITFIKPLNKDLPAIYQKAEIFLYPSFYEGFGIPIIEALFSKIPVITSNSSSLPEAAGPHSYLIDPTQPGQITQGIATLLTDDALRKQTVEQGFIYAQQFKGEPLTDKIIKLYREVVNDRSIIKVQ